MVLDGHIHINTEEAEADRFHSQLRAAGIDGGLLISLPPPYFANLGSSQQRLENLMALVEGHPHLFPFYWLDPLEGDAHAQVELARERGVAGFKIIFGCCYPDDPRVLPVLQAIADRKLPVLFHSGILWDRKATPSARYNRPAEFEGLLAVDGLRFSLAHISWPWCDELIALYGKVTHTPACVEMFVDTTPGTPPIYRGDALTKLYTVGYDVARNVIFGSDSCAPDYNGRYVNSILDGDRGTLRSIGVSDEDINLALGGNLIRFVGKDQPLAEETRTDAE